MVSDEEGAVQRLERIHDSLNVNRHYMTRQTCREVQRDIRIVLDALRSRTMRDAPSSLGDE